MISNCIAHNRMLPLSYITGLNNNSRLFTIIFNRGHHKPHHVFRASLLLLQITPAKIYPITSLWNSFNFFRALKIISTTFA